MTPKTLTLVLMLPLLVGCEKLGLPNWIPGGGATEADGKAIGGACRHAGRALEDCFILNPGVSKSAIFTGWREMNDYMRENQIESVAPTLPNPALQPPKPPEPPPAATPPAPEPEPAPAPEPTPTRRRPGQAASH